ncbi:hypothetical protein GGR50DRAFT_54891 [Xylaria sp. CBS 124048]|nr:hypothetical protein GGR50DRAFT_54891 [Xylaria sp. CBS 124048]
MTAATEPEALLAHLHKVDGSATYSYAGYTVVGAVNGPLEVQKRDELPEEAFIDVNVRPVAGIGGVRERHLESLLQSTLRQVILVSNFPRTLIQITLQITVAPENEYVNGKLVQANMNLPLLPALLHTAILALLSASLPMTTYLTSTSLAILMEDGHRQIVINPTARQIEQSQSFHVLAFTSYNELILAESEGNFTMKDWDDIYNASFAQCCPANPSDDTDTLMDEGMPTTADLGRFIRSTVEQKAISDLHWI